MRWMKGEGKPVILFIPCGQDKHSSALSVARRNSDESSGKPCNGTMSKAGGITWGGCEISAPGGFKAPAWQASVSRFVGRSHCAVGQGGEASQIPSGLLFHLLVFICLLLCHLGVLLRRSSSGSWDFHMSCVPFRMLTGSFAFDL